ncbi:MAG: hypothetical protein J5896_06290 [Alphaproteobacteria bacterium]|nr:hypothetical protein [Alphaproteobacteria bacterium]
MQVNLTEKNATFLFDKEGIIIVTDIEKTDFVVMGELIYDGKNVAILNRNNKSFYTLKNIAPLFRAKLKQAKDVTIVEQDKNSIYSYKVAVNLKEDLGFEDNFDVFAEKVMTELQQKMTPEQFEQFLNESEKYARSMEE